MKQTKPNQHKSASQDDRKPIKLLGKTPEPLSAHLLSNQKFSDLNLGSKNSFSSQGILGGTGATKGLSVKDVYRKSELLTYGASNVTQRGYLHILHPTSAHTLGLP